VASTHLWLWSLVIVWMLPLMLSCEGGIAAVIWTDLMQFVSYVGGSLLAAYELLHLIAGGWSGFLDAARAAGKLQVWSSRWDLTVPFTVWAGVVGGTFPTNAPHGTDPPLAERPRSGR